MKSLLFGFYLQDKREKFSLLKEMFRKCFAYGWFCHVWKVALTSKLVVYFAILCAFKVIIFKKCHWYIGAVEYTVDIHYRRSAFVSTATVVDLWWSYGNVKWKSVCFALARISLGELNNFFSFSDQDSVLSLIVLPSSPSIKFFLNEKNPRFGKISNRKCDIWKNRKLQSC